MLKRWWLKCRLWLVLKGSRPSYSAQLNILIPRLFLEEGCARAGACYFCKDLSNRKLSSGICFVSDESCVRCEQQCLMKRLGRQSHRGQSIAVSAILIYHVIYHHKLLRGWPQRFVSWHHFSRGNHIISAFRAVSHTPLRDGRGERERSGAAWHPTRTGCEAEAASDNTPCWGCRQPLVHLFSPLNHGSQIESCCLATLYISVLLLTPCERGAKLNDQVFHTWNKSSFQGENVTYLVHHATWLYISL